jgi:hypothetical protein
MGPINKTVRYGRRFAGIRHQQTYEDFFGARGKGVAASV